MNKLTPRQRARVYQVAMYVLGAVLTALVLLVTDWPKVQKNFFNTGIAADMFPGVVTTAVKNTALYTALSFVLGMVLALVLALMRLSSMKPFRAFAIGYIELFRGLPALITLLFVGFGLPIAFSGFRIPGGVLGRGSVGQWIQTNTETRVRVTDSRMRLFCKEWCGFKVLWAQNSRLPL